MGVLVLLVRRAVVRGVVPLVSLCPLLFRPCTLLHCDRPWPRVCVQNVLLLCAKCVLVCLVVAVVVVVVVGRHPPHTPHTTHHQVFSQHMDVCRRDEDVTTVMRLLQQIYYTHLCFNRVDSASRHTLGTGIDGATTHANTSAGTGAGAGGGAGAGVGTSMFGFAGTPRALALQRPVFTATHLSCCPQGAFIPLSSGHNGEWSSHQRASLLSCMRAAGVLPVSPLHRQPVF